MTDKVSLRDALNEASRDAQAFRDARRNADEVVTLRAEIARLRAELDEAAGHRCAYAQGAHGIAGCGKCFDCVKSENVKLRAENEQLRAALLGLERDKTIADAQSAGHKAGRAAAAVEYESEIKRLHGVIKGWELKWAQRDERAERIGKLVLSWRCGTCGMDAVKLYGGFVRTCDRCGPALKRAIADAMEGEA